MATPRLPRITALSSAWIIVLVLMVNTELMLRATTPPLTCGDFLFPPLPAALRPYVGAEENVSSHMYTHTYIHLNTGAPFQQRSRGVIGENVK